MAVETEGKETQRAFAFACFTGLRISDIRSLKWTDIKNPDIAPTIVMEQTKTHDVVRVPISVMRTVLLLKTCKNVYERFLLLRILTDVLDIDCSQALGI